MNDVFVKVDGVNLNATHFGAMSAADAQKKMVADGIAKAKEGDWGIKAHALLLKGLEDAKKKAEEEANKKKK